MFCISGDALRKITPLEKSVIKTLESLGISNSPVRISAAWGVEKGPCMWVIQQAQVKTPVFGWKVFGPRRDECWRALDRFPGIEVSNAGRVRNTNYNHTRVLESWPTSDGYRSVNFKSKSHLIHRLVMEAFHGKSDLFVNHKNFIRHDNNVENLEYVTAKGNAIHYWTDGVDRERMDKIVALRSYIHAGYSITPTLGGKLLGMSRNVVSNVGRGFSWGHIKPHDWKVFKPKEQVTHSCQ